MSWRGHSFSLFPWDNPTFLAILCCPPPWSLIPLLCPHFSLRPRSSRKKSKLATAIVPALTPQCVHTYPTPPVSHGVWKVSLPTVVITSRGFASLAILHSLHCLLMVPSAQCLGWDAIYESWKADDQLFLGTPSILCSVCLLFPWSCAHHGW